MDSFFILYTISAHISTHGPLPVHPISIYPSNVDYTFRTTIHQPPSTNPPSILIITSSHSSKPTPFLTVPLKAHTSSHHTTLHHIPRPEINPTHLPPLRHLPLIEILSHNPPTTLTRHMHTTAMPRRIENEHPGALMLRRHGECIAPRCNGIR